MNVHHLELFYYVARHGGISEAVRNIPYGIQQPAVSGQIIQLEEDLGLTLFQRRPFQLTSVGEELYAFIKPFFDNVDGMAEKLRGGGTQLVRIAGTHIALTEHLPQLLRSVRQKFPRLRFTLHEGIQPQVVDWLAKQQIDIAVTVLEGKPPAGIRAENLLELPIVLLVHKSSKLSSSDELWKRDRIAETLISLPANEAVCRSFQQGLARLKVDWPTGIEVNSLDLVETYVANGFGIGVSVAAPGAKWSKELRVLPLPDFQSIVIGVLWLGKLSPVTQSLLEELKKHVAGMAKVGHGIS